jgi:hypothetical protein
VSLVYSQLKFRVRLTLVGGASLQVDPETEEFYLYKLLGVDEDATEKQVSAVSVLPQPALR